MKEKKMWINKKGEEVHEDLVRIDDRLKDEMVKKIIAGVARRETELVQFKQWVTKQISDYMDMLREKYSLDPMAHSRQGNLTLESFDGLMRVQIAVQKAVSLNEKLALAKEKIDTYLKEITAEATPDIQTLISKVFEVDGKGNVNAKMVLSLKSYNISHPLWRDAMALIDEAIEVVGSKSYIRFYRRDNIASKWVQISLDFASK